MAPIQVHIKHAGKTYDLPLDVDLPASAFKDAIYHATGVPPDRMKVMVKGGVLKDDSSWKKIGPKAGQTFTVIGAAGELPKAPEKPIVFLEDMDDAELAEALAKPVGLVNLGNTCYMNATLQAMRGIPELQNALSGPSLQSTTPLPQSLRDLFANMSKTTDSITPLKFLQVLREVNPQFAELDRREGNAMAGLLGKQGYAQQDAEECYSSIVNSLRNVPGLDENGESLAAGAEAVVGRKRFVEQYMMGELRRELRCDEAPEEEAGVSTEQILKVECNISATTNFMLSGILSSLDTKIEKNSPTLGRTAIYSQKSRLSRLPSYLTVHMVRFSWRDDIGKKAKIMRKVKFPLEFDALDLVTDDYKSKLLPVSRRLKELEKDRTERRKVRKRTKTAAPAAAAAPATNDVEMGDATEPAAAEETVEEEGAIRAKEANELAKLIPEDVQKDVGSSATGLYDLVAIVTHKGANADGGHYIGFVKKSVFHAYQPRSEGPSSTRTSAEIDEIEGDEDWYKFDDDKVSVFPKEKLSTLDGGGEDSSAYVLIYKSKDVLQ